MCEEVNQPSHEYGVSNRGTPKITLDLSQLQITTIKFEESNYLTWSKSTLIYIKGKDKEDYLIGAIKTPALDDPKYQKWKTENALVMEWLLNSMKPEVSGNYLFLDTTHQIWSSLSETFSEVGHVAKVYDLRQQIAKFKQRDLPLSIYYFSLGKMWEELEHYTTYCPSCVKDSTAHKKHVEEIQALEFLVGLNSEYEQVWVNLFGNDPLPPLHEVQTHVHRKERGQGTISATSSIKKSTLVSSQRGGRGGSVFRGCVG